MHFTNDCLHNKVNRSRPVVARQFKTRVVRPGCKHSIKQPNQCINFLESVCLETIHLVLILACRITEKSNDLLGRH